MNNIDFSSDPAIFAKTVEDAFSNLNITELELPDLSDDITFFHEPVVLTNNFYTQSRGKLDIFDDKCSE